MSNEESNAAPPSYDDATSLPGRRPPHPRPTPEIAHTINIRARRPTSTSPLPVPFPSDEAAWTSPTRDVQHDDWARFVSNLADARSANVDKKKEAHEEDEVTEEQIQSMREVLSLWNYNFFEPRGCKIYAEGFDEVKQTEDVQKKSMFIFGKEGIGYKTAGGGIIGVSFPKIGGGST